MSDPLADVLREASDGWWSAGPVGVTLAGQQAEAVKAHIAAVLDAEEARAHEVKKVNPTAGYAGVGTVNNLRASLLGTTEETP